MPRGLRPAEDPRHRLLRARHAGAAQGQKDLLRHEDTGQTEGMGLRKYPSRNKLLSDIQNKPQYYIVMGFYTFYEFLVDRWSS